MTHDPKKKVWTRIPDPDMIYVRGDTEAVATDGALIWQKDMMMIVT